MYLNEFKFGSITSQVGSSIELGEAITYGRLLQGKRSATANAKIGNYLHIHAQKASTGKSILDGAGLPITYGRLYQHIRRQFFD